MYVADHFLCFLWVSSDRQAAEYNALSDMCMLASNIVIDI